MRRWNTAAGVALVAGALVMLPNIQQAQSAYAPASQNAPADSKPGQPGGLGQGRSNKNPCPIGSTPRAAGDSRPPTSPDVIAALSLEDKKALFNCLQSATAEGNSAAAALLGEQYRVSNGIVPLEYGKAIEYTKKAIDLGNIRALTTLADMYMAGQGVKKDPAEAMKLYLDAADKGDMKAPRYVGVNYEFGNGASIDYDKAEHYYQMSAEKSDITGECLLGSMYERGLGVPQSYDKAVDLYTKSAARGDVISAPAMAALGSLYETRNDGKQDLKMAVQWYGKAANLKDHEAQADLARLTSDSPKPASTPRNLCLTIFEQKCDLPTNAPCK